MKVLVVTNDFPPRVGGIQTYVHELLSRLDEDVTVVASTSAGAEAFDRGFRHKVVRLPTAMLLPTPGVTRRVAELVRSEHADVVLFGASMPLALLGPTLERRLGVPYVAFTHGLEIAASRVPVVRRVLSYSLCHAAAVTAVSTWTADVLKRAVPRARITLLPAGVDCETFHPEVSDAAVRARYGLARTRVIGCVSRLVRRKGQDVLLEAFGELARDQADLRLLIVGSGPDRGRLESMARARGLQHRVVFTGEVAQADLPMHFRAADIFVMPCRSRGAGLEVEAFGVVYLQAAAVGRPVIAGRSGGTSDAVRDRETGLLVDGSRVADVRDAIQSLLDDPKAAEAMGARGAAWTRQRRGWNQTAADARALLRAAVAQA